MPSDPTVSPSVYPTQAPSQEPTQIPSNMPTKVPTDNPTLLPTMNPSLQPTYNPSRQPSMIPSYQPTYAPTGVPSTPPTAAPTDMPSVTPSNEPTFVPSKEPTPSPTCDPTDTSCYEENPTRYPTIAPTFVPSSQPSQLPTFEPTNSPTVWPTQVFRATTKILNSEFSNSYGTQSVFNIEIITNNWYYNETDVSLNYSNGRVFIESTTFHSHTSIQEGVVSIVSDPTWNCRNWWCGVSMIMESNAFINNTDIDALIYSDGTDLELHQLFIAVLSNNFTNNEVNIGIFELENTQLVFDDSYVYNHFRMIYGTIVTILATNIITDETQVMYLTDERYDSVYGNNLLMVDCEFYNHTNAYEVYIAPEDDMDIHNAIFKRATINIYVGVENNDVTDVKDDFGYQWSMCNVEIAGFYDKRHFVY